MLLTLVLFYFTYIQVSYTLPPLANVYGNNADNQYRYNERFLQRGPFLEHQNTFTTKFQNYPPVNKNIGTPSNYNVAQSNVVTSPPGNIAIINNNVHEIPNNENLSLLNLPSRPEVNHIIRTVPKNDENIFNGNVKQERVLPQFQRDNLAQYGLPQNFKINLRGYVGPVINNGFIPPQPILPKPFSLSQIRHAQKTIQPTGVNNVENNVNHPILNPLSLSHEVKLDNPFRQSKKSYTIVHPNGTVEETDDFEYIKKNYPYYIVHDLSEKTTKKHSVAETEVHAGSPFVNPTIVPIHNLPPVQPLSNISKETLVPNTLVQITHSQTNPTKIEEPIMTNASNFNKENVDKPIVTRNVTSENNSIKSGSAKLYTNIIETVKSTEKSNNALPLLDEKVISPSEIIKVPEKSEDANSGFESLQRDDVNEMLEKISAADFWTQIDVIEISDEAASTDVNKKTTVESLETTDLSEDGQFIKNATTNPDIITTPLTNTNLEKKQLNLTDIDDSYEVFNTNPDIVEDFVSSIEDRIEFIKPFLILNETDQEASDQLSEHFNSTEQGYSNLSDANVTREAGQDITKPIYIPHISIVDSDDTNSSFWFTTNDEKAWQKLAPQNKKNVIASTLSSGENKTVSIYNGTETENTTKLDKPDAKPVRVRLDNETEIKSGL